MHNVLFLHLDGSYKDFLFLCQFTELYTYDLYIFFFPVCKKYLCLKAEGFVTGQ